MTVSSQTSNETFYGNGGTTTWDLPFRFFNDSDIYAYLIDPATQVTILLALGTDYTLTGAGLPEQFGVSPGKITTLSPVANGKQLYVERVMEVEQPTDVLNQARFFAEVHEDVFDRLTMLIQQAIATFGRALKRPVGKEYFDAENRVIKNVADGGDPQDAVNFRSMFNYVDSAIAGVIGGFGNFLQAGIGAVMRTFQSKMRERWDASDYGILGDGSDERIKIQSFVTAGAGRELHFNMTAGGGIYGSGGPIRLFANTRIVSDPRVEFMRLGTTESWMFVNGVIGDTTYATGYNGDSNIDVIGNTFNLNGMPGVRTAAAFVLGHSRGIRIRDNVFKNGYNSHNIEINANADGIIEGNTFQDQAYSDTTSSYETINIDYANAAGFPGFGAWDNTPDMNIIVRDNTFRNVQGGVSSHSVPVGGVHSNIQVLNNTFENIGGRAVRAQGWNGAKIIGNTFINIGQEAITVLTGNGNIIKNNIIKGASQLSSGAYSAIRIAGDGNIAGDNIIDNTGYANSYPYPYGIASGTKNIINTKGAKGGSSFLAAGMVSDNGTLTSIDGLTVLYAGDAVAPTTINLADSINNYEHLVVNTGQVAGYTFQSHLLRPFNRGYWTTTDKIALQTIGGVTTGDITSMTQFNILADVQHIRAIYGATY